MIASAYSYLASIALWHSAAELANPRAHLLVKMARKAHLRAAGRRQKQATPVGAAELALLEDALEEGRAAADPLARLRSFCATAPCCWSPTTPWRALPSWCPCAGRT